ncbi:MAG: hypothetical protein JWQ19_2383 [Subtercola sp.]|nr:hypothetical protein [Subtercola sp.]
MTTASSSDTRVPGLLRDHIMSCGRVAADRLSRRRSVGLVNCWAALKRALS